MGAWKPRVLRNIPSWKKEEEWVPVGVKGTKR